MAADLHLLELLSAMDRAGASDLFLTEGRPPAARIHGQLRAATPEPTSRAALEALVRRAAPERWDQLQAAGDLDVGLSLDDGRRFRLAIYRQRGALSLVARAVPTGAIPFDRLGLPEEVRAFADKPRGVVLVTGATGSGKSTTLAALVHHINSTRAQHILTVEDPIEFLHQDQKCRITQREVGSDTLSFQTALRHAVRQSPDVIVIGEMRDYETMQVAMSASLTGHLVLASLHTIDTAQTLQRIMSYYPEHLRSQAAVDLSMSLVGIVSQRLLPHAEGKGRVLAAEILTNTPPVARLLREQRIEELQDVLRALRGPGMVPFNDAVLRLHREGKVSYETGLAYASNADEFALSARGMSTGTSTFTARDDAADAGLDLKRLLEIATEKGASDLHLAVGRPPILRKDGLLHPLSERALSDGDIRMLLYSVMSSRQRALYELEREIDFALATEDGRRFRVNAYFQKGRMAAALRSIATRIPTADELGLPSAVLRLGERPQGLLLVVGPTGSGKSTTLACLLDRINRTRACRMITIEDPIEYVHTSDVATIDQREVHADTHSFASALKYILRQDPDVVMVGEMRDFETIGAALTAAETGHLVLATLHSNDAAQAIDRIIDTFPGHQQAQARSQLASALLGVISQRLLTNRAGQGRIGVFEVMMGTPAVRNLIRENKLHQIATIMETGRKDGMVTLDAALREAYEAGKITYEEALRFVINPKTIVERR